MPPTLLLYGTIPKAPSRRKSIIPSRRQQQLFFFSFFKDTFSYLPQRDQRHWVTRSASLSNNQNLFIDTTSLPVLSRKGISGILSIITSKNSPLISVNGFIKLDQFGRLNTCQFIINGLFPYSTKVHSQSVSIFNPTKSLSNRIQ